ncbi:MAG: tetratricopeptide repeat protein [Nitrospirae bacterium]|nr:tetratricopeptide repeat protein [Nitrospirota bacterium]
MTYIRLLFLPVNQNLDYDYPVYHSFLNPNVFLSFLFLMVIFCIGVYLLYRSRITHYLSVCNAQAVTLRITAFGILWFFVTLSVESSVIPIVDVIFEHRVYLPSIGAIIATTTFMFVLSIKIKDKLHHSNKIIISILSLIIIVFSVSTYSRNTLWLDGITLWNDVIMKSPNKARGYNELGRAYLQHGDIKEALQRFETTLKLDPQYEDAYNNLGIAYMSLHSTDKAIEYFNMLLKLNPEHIEGHFNLGIIYIERADLDNAIKEFKTILQINPYHYQAAQFLNYLYYK